MRYVIGVCILTGFLIWDGFYHDGLYLDEVVSFTSRLVGSVVRSVT